MTLPRFQLFIDGAFQDAEETFESIDPATGEAWAMLPAAGATDVEDCHCCPPARATVRTPSVWLMPPNKESE